MIMIDVAIIVGSTRPNRKALAVAQWVFDIARMRGDANFEIVDLVDHALPLLDEPVPPSQHKYTHEHTKRWGARIAAFDAFVFVTPEYNRGIPAALKNAIDFLYVEWNNKSAGFVAYGSAGGTRAVEHLRGVMGELQIADVRAQVSLSLRDDFEKFTTFKPGEHQQKAVETMLGQVVSWGTALRPLRGKTLQ
jgi:NAD(P)H-dependent FMN reductase